MRKSDLSDLMEAMPFQGSIEQRTANATKIIHLIGSGGTGGREKQLFLLMRAQAESDRYRISVLFQEAGGSFYSLARGLPKVTVGHLPFTRELSIRNFRTCLRSIRQSDVVVLHSPRIAFMLPVLMTRVMLIYRLSGMFMMPPRLWPISRLARKTISRKSRPRSTQDKTPPSPGDAPTTFIRAQKMVWRKLLTIIRWNLFQRIVRGRAKIVLVNSRFLSEQAQRVYRVPLSKLHQITNGIDPIFEQERLTQAQSLRDPGGAFTICVIARLDVRKRIDRLFEAVAPLIHAKRIIRIRIAGNGDQRQQLEHLACDLGIRDAVEFLGEISNPYDVLLSSDFFVLPSENEAFSNSVLEAMFAKVPVAVFARGCGNAETIHDRVSGFLIKDVLHLRQLIAEIMDDRSLGHRVGSEGHKSLYDQGLTVRHYLDRLSVLIDNNLSRAR